MAIAEANGITLEYDETGDPAAPPMLLIMGLGAQLVDWPDEFCDRLAGRGYRVIRFDNRDAGLSGGFDALGPPDLAAVAAGNPAAAPYHLSDMAADAAGLLDALDAGPAHVVGVSLGGMVAQILTLDFPGHVRSLCSIMSTTGARDVGRSTPEASAVLSRPPARDLTEAIAYGVANAGITGSPAYPPTADELLARITTKVRRAYRPAGTARQLCAVMATPDRTARLSTVTAPTLVLHGDADPLITVSGGKATASAVPGADLVVLPGMGHDLPRELWDTIVDAIDTNARRYPAE